MNKNIISINREETKQTILDLTKVKSINLFRVIEIGSYETLYKGHQTWEQ